MNRASWLAVGSIVGALVALQIHSLVVICAAVLLVFGVGIVTAIGAGERSVGARIAAAAVTVGAMLILGRAALGLTSPAAGAERAGNAAGPNQAEHEAVVLSVATPSGGLQRAIVELRPPEGADRVYAWLPRYPPVVPSDLIRFDGRLETAPTGAGFGEYLLRSGIPFSLRARTLERVSSDGSPLAALESVRRAAAELITRGLPEPQAGLAAAMAIGLRDLVARDVADDFRIAGLSHVVAISGWHIALLGAVVSGLLGGLARRRRSVVVLIAICSYAILAGASPSVVRAAVMASVVLIARESGRRGQASAALALTCVGMLVVDPATIADLGFQLSVTATAGLLAWAGRLRGWLVQRLPAATPSWLLEVLAVSLAAQAATLPLVLFHFGRLSTVAPLANLLVAPLVAPAMLLTALALVAGIVIGLGVPALALAPFSLIGAIGIGSMIAIAQATAGLPYASVELPPPLNLAAALASVMALVFLARRGAGRPNPPPVKRQSPLNMSRRRLAVGGGVAALCLLLVLVNGARPDGRLHVNILDIGQGDAILLQGPSGGRMLIDTGPDPDRLLSVLDARLPAWDRRIDLVVLTHPHEDHVAGLALLLDRYRIGEIVEPGMVGPGPGDAAYRRRLAELGRDSRVVAAGDRLWLDGIRLDVEWPIRGTVPLRPADSGTAINNVSIVLELQFGRRRMLFTGDVEEQIDPVLLASGLEAENGGGPIDVLKVAHHGSATATTDAFVDEMAPRIAVVSAGFGNPYGHPSPKTVARLTDRGAKLFRTDVDGTIEISTDGTDLAARAEGGRPPPSRPSRPTPAGVGYCPIPTQAGARRRPTYNRPDVHPITRGSGCHPAWPGADRPPPRALGRGRRGVQLPVRCPAWPPSGCQHAACRGRGPAARPRQGVASR